jgi:L-ascorbate metabolism protein UlaG (beta-lactamase superfamily)
MKTHDAVARETVARATYIGGPTILLEVDGLRLLTDPTFDPAGSEYTTPVYTLRKTQSPAIPAENLGRVDVVLLSHDHHFDNLDRAGRTVLAHAQRVITTLVGAERLGSPAVGVMPWQTIEIPTPNERTLLVTGTPARHGPPDGDRGPVTGFVVRLADRPDDAIYISGDTVWYDGVADVARRFRVRVAVLFMGAARVREVGPAHLTFAAGEGPTAARAFPDAAIVPLHYEGWEHFSEGRPLIERAFAEAALASRVRWLEPGVPTDLRP